jgi:hypothetical protein
VAAKPPETLLTVVKTWSLQIQDDVLDPRGGPWLVGGSTVVGQILTIPGSMAGRN